MYIHTVCIYVFFYLMRSYIFHILSLLPISPKVSTPILYPHPTIDNAIFFLSLKMHIHLTKDALWKLRVSFSHSSGVNIVYVIYVSGQKNLSRWLDDSETESQRENWHFFSYFVLWLKITHCEGCHEPLQLSHFTDEETEVERVKWLAQVSIAC